jgi:hypothetical protein
MSRASYVASSPWHYGTERVFMDAPTMFSWSVAAADFFCSHG